MQDHNWNDLKVLLALLRSGSLSGAARSLGVSETTVPRRLQNLERCLGADLFIRSGRGIYDPTDLAMEIARHAEMIELEHAQIREKSSKRQSVLQGTVRVSSVPIIINRFLVPRLSDLRLRHPGLGIELIPEARNVDLLKREADLAIRFARPEHGGLSIKTQKLGELNFSTFGPAGVEIGGEAMLGWIGYDSAHANLPQARWIDVAIRKKGQAQSHLWVADAETALEAVASGQGKTILPDCIGTADPRLRRLRGDADSAPDLRREIWLLSHSDQSGRASVAAAQNWLTALHWDS